MADSTSFLLEQWSLWARCDRRLYLRHPSQSAFHRLVKTSSRAPSPAISDLVASEIDHAVAQVCNSNREAGNALVRYYLFRQPYYKIGRAIRINRRRVPQLVRLGEAGVAGILDGELAVQSTAISPRNELL